MFYNAKNCILNIDNTTVDYISFGKGIKNLIIIPGVGDGFKTVKGLAIPFSIMYKIFAKEYRVYVFSRRNMLSENFSTKDMANDIINHMNELKIDSADIVGVSQGGMIAQYIAINAPDKVNKLVLVVTGARNIKILDTNIAEWIKMAEEKNYKGIMLDNAKKSYTGKYLKSGIKMAKIIGLFDKNIDYKRFIIQAKSCVEHDLFDRLDKIKCQTLIIGAKQDKVIGIEASEELNKQIINSKLYVYDEYSHAVYEQAKDFNNRVLDFLIK